MTTGRDRRVQGSRNDLIRLSTEILADGLTRVSVHGELDLATADRTVRYVTKILDRHDGPVSVDLSGLEFCDACGLGALIRISAYAERSDRRIELTSPSPAVARLMRITGAERLLTPALALSPGGPGQARDPADLTGQGRGCAAVVISAESVSRSLRRARW